MAKVKPYVVVHFLAENEVEAIPSNWLDSKDRCFWPPFKSNTSIINAARERIAPGVGWSNFRIRIMTACGKFYFSKYVQYAFVYNIKMHYFSLVITSAK